ERRVERERRQLRDGRRWRWCCGRRGVRSHVAGSGVAVALWTAEWRCFARRRAGGSESGGHELRYLAPQMDATPLRSVEIHIRVPPAALTSRHTSPNLAV